MNISNFNKMNNYLPNDLMSMILSMRTEEMKKDREKLKYDKVMKSFNKGVFYFKQEHFYNEMEKKGLFREKDFSKIQSFIKNNELWEIPHYFNNLLSNKDFYDREAGEIGTNYLNVYIE
jgi:hypothetical protein